MGVTEARGCLWVGGLQLPAPSTHLLSHLDLDLDLDFLPPVYTSARRRAPMEAFPFPPALTPILPVPLCIFCAVCAYSFSLR